MNLGWQQQKTFDGVDGDADALRPGVFGVGLGAVNVKTETNLFSQELENEKSRFKLCLVKRSY